MPFLDNFASDYFRQVMREQQSIDAAVIGKFILNFQFRQGIRRWRERAMSVSPPRASREELRIGSALFCASADMFNPHRSVIIVIEM
jgi:hypothetical protein